MDVPSSSAGLASSGYNYVVTAQKPTSVKLSAVGRFTSATDINLVVS
jgi:hypothetical protein